MLTLERVRELLAEEAAGKSDAEIEAIRDGARVLAEGIVSGAQQQTIDAHKNGRRMNVGR